MKRNQLSQIDMNAIQPFQVRMMAPLNLMQQQSLLLCYQPIMGYQAVSLYFTLGAQTKGGTEWGPRRQHAHLLDTMDIDLVSLAEAKRALEAVGLLKTYRQRMDEIEHDRPLICYELILPLDIQAFFQQPFLSTSLYQTIGDLAYHQLLQEWEVQPILADKFIEVSTPFSEVFGHIQPDEVVLPDKELTHQIGGAQTLQVQPAMFKYEELVRYLQQDGLDTKQFTQIFKAEVMAISALYQLTLEEAIQLVNLAANEFTGKIELDQLKEIAERQHYYKHRKQGTAVPPSSINSQEQAALQAQLKQTYPDLTTEQAEIILLCQQLPPSTFLEKTKQAKGGFATDSEQFYVSEVLAKSQLSATLVNFLIYDLLTRRERTSVYKAELERIANEWQQLKFEHPAQVLAYIKQQEHVKQPLTKGRHYAGKTKQKRVEVVPKWLDNQTQATETPSSPPVKTDTQINQTEIQERIDQLFKERN